MTIKQTLAKLHKRFPKSMVSVTHDITIFRTGKPVTQFVVMANHFAYRSSKSFEDAFCKAVKHYRDSLRYVSKKGIEYI